MTEARDDIRRNVGSTRMLAVRGESAFPRTDRLAAEEPMEIRAGGPGQEPANVAVTMRTPGSDFELAAGFLFTEGLIGSREEIDSVAYCELPPEEQQYNVVTVRLRITFDAETLRRNFFATSSCGVCGKASMDQLDVRCDHIPPGPVVAGSTILELPSTLRDAQRIFEQTGGLHAAGLFDRDGRLLSLREDVGRHNAAGQAGRARRSWPARCRCPTAWSWCPGGPASSWCRRRPWPACPSCAPCRRLPPWPCRRPIELGMTVVGFLRRGSFNVYTHPDRIDLTA